jgi:hypothetical protein
MTPGPRVESPTIRSPPEGWEVATPERGQYAWDRPDPAMRRNPLVHLVGAPPDGPNATARGRFHRPPDFFTTAKFPIFRWLTKARHQTKRASRVLNSAEIPRRIDRRRRLRGPAIPGRRAPARSSRLFGRPRKAAARCGYPQYPKWRRFSRSTGLWSESSAWSRAEANLVHDGDLRYRA